MDTNHDVLIIGGGPAGLSAALSLGRMGRTALVCDDGRPRNAPSAHMNNFPGHDGLSPSAWRDEVRKNLQKYPTIHFQAGRVETVKKEGAAFIAEFSSGERTKFRKVILAYGVRDNLPPVPGLAELWGKAVFHCPYCHGFEVRGHALGMVANGDIAAHMAPMIYSLSQDLILFTNGPAQLKDEVRALLSSRGVRVIEDSIAALETQGETLRAVKLQNGETVSRDALFWSPSLPYTLKSSIGRALGCELTETGLYQADILGKTSVSGVFAAGDNANMMHSVLNAASAGQRAGAGAVFELVNEDLVTPTEGR